MFTYLFLAVFIIFHSKASVFIILISFFDEVSNFYDNIYHSETVIHDKKLSVELMSLKNF